MRATKVGADDSVWPLKVNETRGQLWLSADGKRLRVYRWTGEGPRLAREE